jgi:hypothetical protein
MEDVIKVDVKEIYYKNRNGSVSFPIDGFGISNIKYSGPSKINKKFYRADRDNSLLALWQVIRMEG